MESYAQTFDEEGALDTLETFASENGPNFYGLPLNEKRVILEKVDNQAADTITTEGGPVLPFLAGETLSWKFTGFEN